jgi:hypothetical protein
MQSQSMHSEAIHSQAKATLNALRVVQSVIGCSQAQCLLRLRQQQIHFLNFRHLIICEQERLALFFSQQSLTHIIQL